MWIQPGEFTASRLYGAAGQGPTYGVAAPTQGMGTDTLTTGWKTLADPHNPLFWFGVVLVVTVGAAGFAGSGRIGPIKVSGSVGSS